MSQQLHELKHSMVKYYKEWGWVEESGKVYDGLASEIYSTHGEIYDYATAYKKGKVRYFTVQNPNTDIVNMGFEFDAKHITPQAAKATLHLIKSLNSFQRINSFFLDIVVITKYSYEYDQNKTFTRLGEVLAYFQTLADRPEAKRKYTATMTKKRVIVKESPVQYGDVAPREWGFYDPKNKKYYQPDRDEYGNFTYGKDEDDEYDDGIVTHHNELARRMGMGYRDKEDAIKDGMIAYETYSTGSGEVNGWTDDRNILLGMIEVIKKLPSIHGTTEFTFYRKGLPGDADSPEQAIQMLKKRLK